MRRIIPILICIVGTALLWGCGDSPTDSSYSSTAPYGSTILMDPEDVTFNVSSGIVYYEPTIVTITVLNPEDQPANGIDLFFSISPRQIVDNNYAYISNNGSNLPINISTGRVHGTTDEFGNLRVVLWLATGTAASFDGDFKVVSGSANAQLHFSVSP